MEVVMLLMLVMAIIFGYIANIYKFLYRDETVATKLCRFSGFFIPAVGVVLGFIN